MNFTTISQTDELLTPARRDEIVETLATLHFFDLEKLLAWPDRLMAGSWWNSADVPAAINYPPAMDCFLADCWASDESPDSFAEDMNMIASALYLARGSRHKDTFLFGHQIHPVHDGVLLLLENHVDRLKTVWRLDQDNMKAFPADPAALAYLDASTQEECTDIGFADWVLETWLPVHVLFYGRKAIEREKAEKAARNVGGDARRATAGGPGDLTP